MFKKPNLQVMVSGAIAAFLLGLMLPSLGLAITPDEIKAKGYIEIITTAGAPPFSNLNPDTSQYEGIDVDIAKAISRELGVEPRFSEVEWGGLIAYLQAGRAALLADTVFITEKRAQVIDFTQPLYGWGEGLLIKEGAFADYTDLNSLSGKRVGVLLNSVQYDMAKEVEGVKDVVSYPDYITLMADLKAGRIDVSIMDPPSVVYSMRDLGITGLKFVKSYKPIKDWKVGFAVQRGDKELLDAIDGALLKMKKSGELKTILDNYGFGEFIAE